MTGTTRAVRKAAPAAKVVKDEPELLQHPLAHMIPEPKFGPVKWTEDDDGTRRQRGEYVSRVFEGVSDLRILQDASATRHNTLLVGPTGTGKTSLVMAYAACTCNEYPHLATCKGKPLVHIPCNGAIDPSELFGTWQPTDDGKWVWVDGLLTLTIIYGGIPYFDEVNFMPPKIAAVVHGLLDKRRKATIMRRPAEISLALTEGERDTLRTFSVLNAHRDCQIVASMNENYHGTKPLNEAFRNRFAYQLVFTDDSGVEEKLISSWRLRQLAKSLRDAHAAGEIQTPPSTNMFQEFELQAKRLGVDVAIQLLSMRFSADERTAINQYFVAAEHELRAAFPRST